MKQYSDEDNEVNKPEPIIEIAYTPDFKVQVVRHVSNILILTSKEPETFSLQISLENNIERDVAALLLRGFHEKF